MIFLFEYFSSFFKSKGPIVVDKFFLFKCSIKRFKSFRQAQVQKLNSEFTSNSVFLTDFKSYDTNEQSYTIEIFKVFSTNSLPLRFNGFVQSEIYKNNQRVLFVGTESRSYEPAHEHDSSGYAQTLSLNLQIKR